MDEIRQYAKENFIPIIRDETSKKLIEICKEINPKRILEIGTAIGYSGILMLQSCSAMLYTIEKDEKRAEMAKENFKRYNLSNRVVLFVEDAQKTLEELCKTQEKFDLIFLDGAKGQYIKYYPFIKALLNKDAVLFTDNIYLHGYVQSNEKVPHKHRSMVVNLRKFIDQLGKDSDFETTFYEIDDGYSISILK